MYAYPGGGRVKENMIFSSCCSSWGIPSTSVMPAPHTGYCLSSNNNGIITIRIIENRLSCPFTTQLRRNLSCRCRSRREIIMDEEGGGGGGVDDCAAYARLEAYTEAVTSEVLLVHALLDGQQDQVIIFKGFSSSLVRRTSSNPSKPVLPSRAIIKSIDRIRVPFNPSNIDYIQKDLSWEEFEELLKGK